MSWDKCGMVMHLFEGHNGPLAKIALNQNVTLPILPYMGSIRGGNKCKHVAFIEWSYSQKIALNPQRLQLCYLKTLSTNISYWTPVKIVLLV